MFYQILEISTDKASGHTYVLVHFWAKKADQVAGKSPHYINDFLMQLRPTGVRVVTNDDGWFKQLDGTFVDPGDLKPGDEFEAETVDRDLPAEIKANIEAYWERAEAAKAVGKPYPVNHSNSRVQRDNSDPHGVLARADVAALRGKEVNKS